MGYVIYCIDLEKQTKYARAVDWIMFMRYVVPTLVIELLDKQQQQAKEEKKKNTQHLQEAKKGLVALSKAYDLILQYEITVDDIADIKRHMFWYS